MPFIGEIKRGNELGYKHNIPHIWATCKNCGQAKWKALIKGKPERELCRKCATQTPEFRERARKYHLGRHLSEETKMKMAGRVGEKSPHWKGGRWKDKGGYMHVVIDPKDIFHIMCPKNGRMRNYIMEHRLIMARYLGRILDKKEVVHHKNGVRDDNRLVNLALMRVGSHSHRTLLLILQHRIRELEGDLSKVKML